MTPSEVASRLRKIHKRRFRQAEMTEYAVKLGLKTTCNLRGAALHYVWEESDIEKLNNLIS